MVSPTDELPAEFSMTVPDGALAPSTQKGTLFVFSRHASPVPGWAVLVETNTGQRFVRRYSEPIAGRWQALSSDPAYPTLDSLRDGLKIIAVATWRAGGAA